MLLVLLANSPFAVEAQGLDSVHHDSAGTSGMADMPGMGGMGAVHTLEASSGRMIVPMIKKPMIPGLEGVLPTSGEFRVGAGMDTRTLPHALPGAELRVQDGDTVTFTASIVQRTIGGHAIAMYAFNGEIPGPRIRVRQGATFYVRFENKIDQPLTMNWHGIRLANAFNGFPGVTQAPVPPGGTFMYAVHCPDAGLFFYHDLVRADITLPMGLYGNVYVDQDSPPAPAPAKPAPAKSAPAPARQEFLILSDLLLDGDSVISYGRSTPNFALMGRFGNVLLINGEPRWHLAVRAGQVVRFLLTNVASARTYNLSFGGAPIKLIASDGSPYTREVMVQSIVIAPGERYIVDVLFDKPGRVAMVNQVQTIDHFYGMFSADVDTMGYVAVSGGAVKRTNASLATLHGDSATVRDIARYRPAFDRPPDEEIMLTMEIHGLPIPVMQLLSVDTLFRPPLEWTDGMSDMNWLTTGNEVRWIFRDRRTGAENMNIKWRFAQGDVIKIRIFNDPRSLHTMNHPIHLQGERFLVVARDGILNPYLVWKDTAVIPVGSTVDLLVDLSNPGIWILSCHILEHMGSGMMMPIKVDAK